MKKSIFSFSRPMSFMAAALALVVLISACKKDLGPSEPIPAAGLMVFNLAPDQQAVGVALSNSLLTNNPLQYTNYNGLYQNIYVGQRDIAVYDYLTDSVVATGNHTFENDNYYSLFVTGNNGNYETVVVEDDVDSTSSADKAYIRYINAVPDSSSPVVTITSAGTKVLDGAAAFNTVSPFAAVNEGEVNVSINNGTNISAARNITLEKGKVYTALLIGDPAKTDSLTKVQIRYIQNGQLPAPAEK